MHTCTHSAHAELYPGLGAARLAVRAVVASLVHDYPPQAAAAPPPPRAHVVGVVELLGRLDASLLDGLLVVVAQVVAEVVEAEKGVLVPRALGVVAVVAVLVALVLVLVVTLEVGAALKRLGLAVGGEAAVHFRGSWRRCRRYGRVLL